MKNKILRTLKMARGRLRLFFGFCPACNSDAPEMYDCHVCEWPTQPFIHINSDGIKDRWWDNFKRQLAGPSPVQAIQPEPNVESCTAAAWPLPGPILSNHWEVPVAEGFNPDGLKGIEILNGSRAGVEYFNCPQCGNNTFYLKSTTPIFNGMLEHYECEHCLCSATLP